MNDNRPPIQQYPQQDELLTVSDLAQILKCKESSIYNLTRKRSVRYARQLPVLRLPCGLRFKRSSVTTWLDSIEQVGAR
jgi:predicted DNA-binding transcriptional regulator AlpA